MANSMSNKAVNSCSESEISDVPINIQDSDELKRKVDDLHAQLEAVVKCGSETVAVENDFDVKIEELLSKLTFNVKQRYENLGEIDTDDFECIALDVIKKHSQNGGALNSLFSSVVEEFERNLNSLEVPSTQKSILIQLDSAAFSDSTEENNKKFIRELNEDKSKLELLTQYKELEYFKFKSFFFDNTDNEQIIHPPPTFDEISTKLSELEKATDSVEITGELSLLKAQYAGLCEVKIQDILYVLDDFACSIDEKHQVTCEYFKIVLSHNERSDSDNFLRHQFYDEIRELLLEPSSNIVAKIFKIEKWLNELISNHWKRFQLKFAEEVGKPKAQALKEIVTTLAESVNAEDLEYQITNAIFKQELTWERLYEMAKDVSDHFSLKQFLIQKGDELRLNQVKERILRRFNYERLQNKDIEHAKSAILDEYERYCGILDTSVKANYVRTIRLYIERLDRLLAKSNNGNIKVRLELWQRAQYEIDLILKNPDSNSETKGTLIEGVLATQINQKVFETAPGLPVALLEHLVISSGRSYTRSESKRESKTGNSVKLDDLFSICGDPVKKAWNTLKNKTVVASFDEGEEYYGLPDNLEENSEFLHELTGAFRKYRLQKFKSAIYAYNANKCWENIISVGREFVYYCSLIEEHAESERSFEPAFQNFIKIFTKIIEYLLVYRRSDQDILKQLRIVIDTFDQDVIKYRLSKCEPEQVVLSVDVRSNLQELRKTLSFKTFKESGYQLFTEEQNRFSNLLAANVSTSERLLETVFQAISKVFDLRILFPPKSPEEIFNLFEKLINNVAGKENTIPSNDEITKWQQFWEDQQHQILLMDLVAEEPNITLKRFLEKIRDPETNFWINILANVGPRTQERLSNIIKNLDEKLSKEDLERLFLASINSDINLESFSMLVLDLYGDKLQEEKIEKLNKETLNPAAKKLIQVSKAVISNAFKVFEIITESNKCKKPKDFIEHLKTLVECIQISPASEVDSLKTVLASLEEIESSFILSILNVEGVKDCWKIPTESKDAITHLQLHLQLPNSFYINQQDSYRFLLQRLFEKEWETGDVKCILEFLMKDLIFRYYTLYYSENSDSDKKLANISTDMQRLYDNLPPNDFIDYMKVILSNKNTGLIASIANFVKSIPKRIINNSVNSNNLVHIWPRMYANEKEHLIALLRFKNVDQSESNEPLEKSKYANNEYDALNKTPSHMWEEELIALRTINIEHCLIDSFSSGDLGLTKVSEFIGAFLFFHEQMGHLKQALCTLEVVCKNVSKFETIEAVKQCLLSLTRNVDLMNVNAIVTSSVGHQLALDLLFMQIDAGNFPKLNIAIQKLKLLLSYRKFDEISQFCRTFLVHAREQHNLDNFHVIIELLIECKAYDRPEILSDLLDKDIFLWAAYLEKFLLLDGLKSSIINGYGVKERKKLVDSLFQLKDVKGSVVQKRVFDKIKNLKKNSQGTNTIKDLIGIIHKITDKPIDSTILDTLTTDLNEWQKILFPQENIAGNREPLKLKELLELMKEGAKLEVGGINETVKPCILSNSEDGVSLIEIVTRKARELKNSNLFGNSKKSISNWEESDILDWAKTFSNSSVHDEVYSWRRSTNVDKIVELLAVIIRATVLYDHHPTGPRDTQLLAVLLFLDGGEGKGRLGNIYTGEGKTLITVMLATCLALMGNVVDVVTSSKVLAVRDSKIREPGSKEGYQGFFKMFGISASNNCDEDCEKRDTGEDERKTRYANCQIIYGETGYFQRDILLTKFFRKEIRPGGNSIGHVLILDEVDSMMIDNAAKTLYISHNITDMSYLRDVFLQIWAAVNSYEERNYSEANVDKIMKYINKIISTSGAEELKINVPSTLMDFVNRNLKTWVESAYEAKYIDENDAYIIGDYGSQQENEIIIMDKDTGVEQTSTKWSNGIHQFIQLKHSGKLSDESLKAVFISNSGYFQMYPKSYGMTGTIGGIEERRLLSQVYGIDFFEIPRFKEYKFEYDFESESVAGTWEEWLNNIVENVNQTMNQNLAYDVEYMNLVKENLEKEDLSLCKFERDILTVNKEISILESEQSKCDRIISTCESARKFAHELASLCEKDDLRVSVPKITKIIEKMEHLLKESDTIVSDHLEHFLSWTRELLEQKSDIDFKEFGGNFNVNVKTYNFATLSNKKKAELEIVNQKMRKAKENLEFLIEAEKKSKADKAFYLTESQNSTGSERSDCRRAVLIICENIDDVQHIENELQHKILKGTDGSLYKTYKYDRAYRKFDLSCLERGDIVIATNIAGRGTDLEVSSEVEANGGLHVMLSYIPKNFRIEKQAFGRTARAGNKGTGTYIVFEARKAHIDKEIDVCQLKTERNEDEARRLSVVSNEQLPKIELEDKLFNQFTVLQQNIESRLKFTWGKFVPHEDLPLYSKTPIDLQLASLNNKWALWLNKMSDHINKVNEKGAEVVINEFHNFENEMSKNLGQKYGLIEEPGELTKLGRLYMDNKQFSDALSCFNHIITVHPLFASIACYYSAFCLVHLESGGYDAKFKAKSFLKKSLNLLEDDRNRILSRNQILKSINDVSRLSGRATDSNLFAKQNEGLAQLLSVHINAIYSAVGSPISADCLIGPGITADQAQRIFDLLTENCMVKNYRISKKCSIRQKDSTNSSGKEISLEVEGSSKTVDFPSVFQYCKDRVLDDLSKSLEKSRNNNCWYKDREKTSSSFQSMIYTKEEFENEMNTFIEVEEMIEIDRNIKEKLLGSMNNSVFGGQGMVIKQILTSDFLKIDKTVLQAKLDNPELTDEDFLGLKVKRSVIKNFFFGKIQFVHGTAYLLKNDFLEELKEIVKVASISASYTASESTTNTETTSKDTIDFTNLLSYLDLNVTSNVVLKHLNAIIKEKAKLLNDKNITEIFSHLENYIQLNIDHNFLEKKFHVVKCDSIFFSRRSEIKDFCLGIKPIEINNGKKLRLLHNQSYSKDEIVEALKIITTTSETSPPDHKRNFDDLLLHLGFNLGQPIQAIKTYKRYHFADPSCICKIKTFLETFNLTNSSNNTETINLIEKLNLGVDYRLGKKSDEIKKTLKSHLQTEFTFKKETFQIEAEAFEILRAILTDAKLINVSIAHLIKSIDQPSGNVNAELENILMGMYNAHGVISDRDLILKDAKTGSQELFTRLVDLNVLKPPKVFFPLGKAKNIPNFLGGNYWKGSSDPAKRVEYITNEIEKVVVEVFKLQRLNDIKHIVSDTIFGFGPESKNKELEEKITTIANIIKSLAGTLRIHPQVKLEDKNLRSIFASGRVPPEILDYIHKSFDVVLDCKQHKAFDWDCFLCGMIGVAQIVAGVSISILSGGSLHFVAQGLISEGIGDIVFAIQSGIDGNFSWKAYSKHKVQSIILTVLTCGVGSYLARGAEVTKISVGLATKTALFKAVSKTVILETCTAVCTAIVNVGAEEISKLVMDELVNEHFSKYFEEWIKVDSSYKQKTISLEQRLNALYNKFGVEAVSQSVDTCLDNSLNQVMTGAIGTKIMNQVSSIVNSVTRSFSMAGNRFKSCGNSKAKIFGEIASLIGKIGTATKFVQNFAQLCNVCNEFNDAVIKEIDALEKKLLEQEKNGTFKVNKEKIAQEKARRSFTQEAQSVSHKVQDKMRVALMLKIKNGFLQPAISAALRAGIRPIQEVLCAPFSKAMQHLAVHIEGRAKQKLTQIMNQNSNKIESLTTAQKRALELRGDIIKADNVIPEMLNMEFSNFPDETIESMKRKHGSDLSIFVKNGELFAVLPTYREFCQNFGKSKVAGVLHLQMAALNEKRNIDVVNVNVHGKDTLEPHDKIPSTIKSGDETNSSNSYALAFTEEQEGVPGHLAPVIKDENGKWFVVSGIKQCGDTENACLAQAILFLKEFERNNGDVGKAKIFAENPAKVAKFNEELAKFGKNSKRCKELYLRGTTVRDEVQAGRVSDISKIEEELNKTNLSQEKYSDVNNILTQINSDYGNSRNKSLLRVNLADKLQQLTSDSSIPGNIKDLAEKYYDNVQRINHQYLFDFNSKKTQFLVKKHTKRYLRSEMGGSRDLVEEQWAFVPFGIPKGHNKSFRFLKDILNDLKVVYDGKIVRMHIINEQADGRAIEGNLVLGTNQMNAVHYHTFEKHMISFLNNHSTENGGLLIKTKVEYPQGSNVDLATTLHISIGTSNKAVQRNLHNMFGVNNNFNPSYRRSGRIDYTVTISTNSGKASKQNCEEHFTSSSDYNDFYN